MIIATHQSEWIKESSVQTINIHFFLPVQQPTGEWACRVSIDTLEKFDNPIYGEDSFQSLTLALKLTRVMMDQFINGGWKLVKRLDDGGAKEFDKMEMDEYINAFFKAPVARSLLSHKAIVVLNTPGNREPFKAENNLLTNTINLSCR